MVTRRTHAVQVMQRPHAPPDGISIRNGCADVVLCLENGFLQVFSSSQTTGNGG
jgi:hypothetical protein